MHKQGYKQLSLTEASYEFCGFEWTVFGFVTPLCLAVGKNSAYVYTTVGEVLSDCLRHRGFTRSCGSMIVSLAWLLVYDRFSVPFSFRVPFDIWPVERHIVCFTPLCI